MKKPLPFFNHLEWSLFLDRDGVLNHETKGDYIKSVAELRPHIENINGLAMLEPFFKHIVVVTNQKGIGKGLYTEETLYHIHEVLLESIVQLGGRIDQFYYSTSVDNNDPLRKPNTGMADLAKSDFPDIHFPKTILVGDTYSDMFFGKKLGMTTVLLPSSITSEKNIPKDLVDFTCKNLIEFANQFHLN